MPQPPPARRHDPRLQQLARLEDLLHRTRAVNARGEAELPQQDEGHLHEVREATKRIETIAMGLEYHNTALARNLEQELLHLRQQLPVSPSASPSPSPPPQPTASPPVPPPRPHSPSISPPMSPSSHTPSLPPSPDIRLLIAAAKPGMLNPLPIPLRKAQERPTPALAHLTVSIPPPEHYPPARQPRSHPSLDHYPTGPPPNLSTPPHPPDDAPVHSALEATFRSCLAGSTSSSLGTLHTAAPPSDTDAPSQSLLSLLPLPPTLGSGPNRLTNATQASEVEGEGYPTHWIVIPCRDSSRRALLEHSREALHSMARAERVLRQCAVRVLLSRTSPKRDPAALREALHLINIFHHNLDSLHDTLGVPRGSAPSLAPETAMLSQLCHKSRP